MIDIHPDIRAFWETRGYVIENDITPSAPIYWKFWVIYPDGDEGINYRTLYVATVALYNGSTPPTERDEEEMGKMGRPKLDVLTYYPGNLSASYNEEEMLRLIKLPAFW